MELMWKDYPLPALSMLTHSIALKTLINMVESRNNLFLHVTLIWNNFIISFQAIINSVPQYFLIKNLQILQKYQFAIRDADKAYL